MTQFKTTLLICFSLFGFIAICFLLFGDRDKFAMMGISGLLLAVLYFIIGLLACIPKTGRQVGKAMLLSAGTMLLIGISVCSLNPVNFNMH